MPSMSYPLSVDDAYLPVPAGRPGTRLLVTNLLNRTQPLIRYELDDLVTASPEPCPCGRPFPLLAAIEGRSDDILELPARGGGTTKVPPVTLRSPLAGIAALSEYRILYRAGELRVEAVFSDTDGRQACHEIESSLAAALAESGAQPPPIDLTLVLSRGQELDPALSGDLLHTLERGGLAGRGRGGGVLDRLAESREEAGMSLPGRDDGQHPRRVRTGVVQRVRHAGRDVEEVAGGELVRLARDLDRERSLQHVEGLVVALAVGRYAEAGRTAMFEGQHRSAVVSRLILEGQRRAHQGEGPTIARRQVLDAGRLRLHLSHVLSVVWMPYQR